MRTSRGYPSEPGTAPTNPAHHEHSLQRTHRNVVLTIAGLCFAGSTAASFIGVWRWYFALRNYGPAVVTRWSAPFILLGIFLAVVGCVYAVYLWYLRGLNVRTSQSGILLQRGGSEEFIPWDHVSGIRSSAIRYGLARLAWGGRANIILHLTDGRRLRLTQQLTDLSRLADTIKKFIYPRLIQEYQEALRAGRAVELGQLRISTEGLALDKKEIAWSAITHVSLDRGVLTLRFQQPKRKRVLRLSVHRVPNIDLCFKLIQHFTSASQADSTDLAANQYSG